MLVSKTDANGHGYTSSGHSSDDPTTQVDFKVHAQARRAKLANFFGDEPPIDISTSEIDRHGLKALLQSRVPLCYFLYMLLEDYNSENLVGFCTHDVVGCECHPIIVPL